MKREIKFRAWDDGKWKVSEAVYMIYDREWTFCNANGHKFIFQPSNYQPKTPPTPPKQ